MYELVANAESRLPNTSGEQLVLRKRALGFTIFPIGSDVSRVTVACLARLDTMLHNDDYFAIGTVATITAVMACAAT